MSVNINNQGLVNASGEEISSNFFTNSDFASTYSETRWDTDKNGTILASSWGGYNGGVTNPTTVYHAHLTQFQGESVYQYTRTANETWLGCSQGGLQSIIQPNTTYTWSIDEYRTSGSNNYITAGLYYKKTSDGSNNFWAGCPHGSGEDAFDKWVRRYYTFTIEEIYIGANVSFYIYGMSGGNGTIYMRRPKLEKGSVPTPWTKKDSEGYTINNHGFVESQLGILSVHDNYIESKNFIEI